MNEPDSGALATTLKFTDMALSPPIHKGVEAVGYEIPSPIQAEVIPHMLEQRDVLGVAQTGTGKTAAFALPVLSKIDIGINSVQALCLTPTRELAIQVAEAFQTYAKFLKNFHVLPIYGGTEYRTQIRQLQRGVHVVVGTPGRVMDHIGKGTLVLDDLQTLILDEADEMLRMGFIDDVEWILQHVPEQHQTALFSATMPAPIKKITKKYLNDPVEVTIKVTTAASPNIRQRYVELRNNEKLDTLTRIMEVENFDAILIFVRTKNATLEVAERMQARGYSAEALNGDIVQNQREKIVNRLRKGQADIIVATDVAARGLDVERISHVINYDAPYDTESYVHRIGRTGRAGRDGDAILFVTSRERSMLQSVEKATKQNVDRYLFPTVEALNERKTEAFFAKIDTELQKDLKEYKSVVEKYLQHNEVDPLKLAAALASIDAEGEPFFFKKSANKVRATEAPERQNKERTPRRRKSAEQSSGKTPDGAKLVTFRLEVGEDHGVGKGDIVGAIANEAGIDSQNMGKIFLHEGYSTIELPDGMPKDVFQTLKKVWVRGRQLQISEVKSSPYSEPRPKSGKPSAKGDSAGESELSPALRPKRSKTPEQIAKGKLKKARKRAEKATKQS